MKKFTQSRLAALRGVPQKTLSNWAKSGKFVPAEYNGRRKPCFYYEDQLPQLEELMKQWTPKRNKPAQILSEPQPDSVSLPAPEHSTNDEHHDETATTVSLVHADEQHNFGNVPVTTGNVVDAVVSLDDRAKRIRQLQADVQRGIIQIGQELIAAKEQVGHGNWSAWIDKEFAWSERTARRFMAVAERFGKTDNVVRFQPSALQAMLALPEGTEQEFIAAQAEQGTPVENQSARDVQKNVKAFKAARTKTKQPTKETAEEPTTDDTSNTDSEATPAQIVAVQLLVDQTDDTQTLRTIRRSLARILAKLDSKLDTLDKKN